MLIKPVCSFAVGQNGHWRATQTTFVEGTHLDVEDFANWVWVYDVEEGVRDHSNQICSKVGYTGDNIPNVDDDTVTDYNYWPESGTYLPWKVSYSDYKGKMISSTPMVWYWQQYTTVR